MWIVYSLIGVFNINSLYIYWNASLPLTASVRPRTSLLATHESPLSASSSVCCTPPTPAHWTLNNITSLVSLEISPRSDYKLFTIHPGWAPVRSPSCVNVSLTTCFHVWSRICPGAIWGQQRAGTCHLPASVTQWAIVELVDTHTPSPPPSLSQFLSRCCC